MKKKRRKVDPLFISRKTIEEVYAILSAKETSSYETDECGETYERKDTEIVQCVDILSECRLLLDRISYKKEKPDMRQREDSKGKLLAQQLKTLESQYILMARVNPQSTNDTQSHLANLDKIVRDIKRIRGRLGAFSPIETHLKGLLYDGAGCHLKAERK